MAIAGDHDPDVDPGACLVEDQPHGVRAPRFLPGDVGLGGRDLPDVLPGRRPARGDAGNLRHGQDRLVIEAGVHARAEGGLPRNDLDAGRAVVDPLPFLLGVCIEQDVLPISKHPLCG